MNAAEAKAVTYKKNPPVRPPQEVYDAIAYSASMGERNTEIDVPLSDENEWYLEDEGYHLESALSDSIIGYAKRARIYW